MHPIRSSELTSQERYALDLAYDGPVTRQAELDAIAQRTIPQQIEGHIQAASVARHQYRHWENTAIELLAKLAEATTDRHRDYLHGEIAIAQRQRDHQRELIQWHEGRVIELQAVTMASHQMAAE